MIIQVILRQVGEDRRFKFDPVHAALIQRMGGYLHHHKVHAFILHLAQDALQIHAFRRRPLRVDDAFPDQVADGSDQADFPAALLSDRLEHVGGAGLSVRSRYPDDAHPARGVSIKRSRHLRHGDARVFHDHLRHGQRKFPFHHKRRRACSHRLRCVSMAIGKRADDAAEHIALPDLAGIVLQRCDRDVLPRAFFMRRCASQFRKQHPISPSFSVLRGLPRP